MLSALFSALYQVILFRVVTSRRWSLHHVSALLTMLAIISLTLGPLVAYVFTRPPLPALSLPDSWLPPVLTSLSSLLFELLLTFAISHTPPPYPSLPPLLAVPLNAIADRFINGSPPPPGTSWGGGVLILLGFMGLIWGQKREADRKRPAESADTSGNHLLQGMGSSGQDV